MMEPIRLVFPLPRKGTGNHAYKLVRMGNVTRLALHGDFRKWKAQIAEITLLQRGAIEAMAAKNKNYLRIDSYFYFHEERIFFGNGNLKPLDTKNFVKQLHDGIATGCGIDDRYFISGWEQKIAIQAEEEQCVGVKIYPAHLAILRDFSRSQAEAGNF